MKKNVRMFIALLTLTALLCGCGKNQTPVVTTAPTAAPTTEPTTEPTAEPTAEPTTEPTTEPATEPAQTGDANLGVIEDGVYINRYIGFSIPFDSTWQYKGAQELQDMPENVAQMFEGSELGDAMDPLAQFTDLLAECAENLTSINVLYQHLDLQSRLAYMMLSNDDILDSVLSTKDMMIDAYTQAGIVVESMEKVTVSFLGEDRAALKMVSNYAGIPYYTLQVFDFHQGTYSVTITFASFMEDNTDQLVAMCQPLEG